MRVREGKCECAKERERGNKKKIDSVDVCVSVCEFLCVLCVFDACV